MNNIEIDLKDYDESLPIIKREASKAIIFINGKLLGLKSDRGDIKLIGGGKEKNEDFIETLIREIREETGYLPIRDSIKYLCDVFEKRKSAYEEAIWELYTKLYVCDIDLSSYTNPMLTKSEKERKQKACFTTIDEAIEINTLALNKNPYPWVYRELLILKEYKKLYNY